VLLGEDEDRAVSHCHCSSLPLRPLDHLVLPKNAAALHYVEGLRVEAVDDQPNFAELEKVHLIGVMVSQEDVLAFYQLVLEEHRPDPRDELVRLVKEEIEINRLQPVNARSDLRVHRGRKAC